MQIRITKIFLVVFIVAYFPVSCNDPGHSKILAARTDTPSYKLVRNWPQPAIGIPLSQPSGLGIDSAQNIFVFNRTGRTWTEPFPDSVISANTILLLDRNSGKLLNSWGANLFIMPHGLTVDGYNQVWVTDVGLQQVFKFDHEGKLLMTLGMAKIPGDDSLHFNRPTDVAVSKDGSFYVSDGYRNSRIVKFSAAGKYLFSWGRKGSKQGEFNLPHAIDLDSSGNVWVADRENNRIQVFNSSGKFIKQLQYPGFSNLYSITIEKRSQQLFAIDFLSVLSLVDKGSDIYQIDSYGKILTAFGRTGNYEGPLCRYHDIAVDHDGNIYVCDILGNQVQKFSRTGKNQKNETN